MKERYGYEENFTGYRRFCARITRRSGFVLLFVRRGILNFTLFGYVGVSYHNCSLDMACCLDGRFNKQRLKNKKNLKFTTI